MKVNFSTQTANQNFETIQNLSEERRLIECKENGVHDTFGKMKNSGFLISNWFEESSYLGTLVLYSNFFI